MSFVMSFVMSSLKIKSLAYPFTYLTILFLTACSTATTEKTNDIPPEFQDGKPLDLTKLGQQ
ncbi:hypothetical protein FIV00_15200 [Labrenzia sp. THAF82]|nr:hypothetical protein FIV00_15200 [Labrenzia sp. THAF82]